MAAGLSAAGLDLAIPILLAPMAGPGLADLAIPVTRQGGLGALPCALLDRARIDGEMARFRAATDGPINLNFFCHTPPPADPLREASWRARLAAYYRELGLDPAMPVAPSNRSAFDEDACALIEQWRPDVVSFHFGLPAPTLLDRVRATGAIILASATTVEEALWLEAHGCHAIIAQGAEAGGHRGMFLTHDITTQIGIMALLPQVVDAVRVPVIAAGGIADGRGIAAALALGASAVQIGTAYLHCPEAHVSPVHRARLNEADETAITNLFTGRPARGIVNRLMRELGPMADGIPVFPLAGGALGPLRAASEPAGSGDFMSLWAGQGFTMRHSLSAGDLTRKLWADARQTSVSAA